MELEVIDTEFYSAAYSNKAVVCSICKIVTFSQVLNFENAVRSNAVFQPDIVNIGPD